MSTQAPLELKKTVNLPKTGFAQKANLGQTEPARLKRWEFLFVTSPVATPGGTGSPVNPLAIF